MLRPAAPAVGSRIDRGDRGARNREADLAVVAGRVKRAERRILPDLRRARIGLRRRLLLVGRPEKGQALGAPEGVAAEIEGGGRRGRSGGVTGWRNADGGGSGRLDRKRAQILRVTRGPLNSFFFSHRPKLSAQFFFLRGLFRFSRARTLRRLPRGVATRRWGILRGIVQSLVAMFSEPSPEPERSRSRSRSGTRNVPRSRLLWFRGDGLCEEAIHR
jgi:hypothetical protein